MAWLGSSLDGRWMESPHEASTALSAFEHSFANGLLLAATQCQADERPVLLVGFDVQVVGALGSVTRSEGLLAVALVLSPVLDGARCAFEASLVPRGDGDAGPPLHSPAAQALAVDPANPNHIVAAAGGAFLSSRDGGQTWAPPSL